MCRELKLSKQELFITCADLEGRGQGDSGALKTKLSLGHPLPHGKYSWSTYTLHSVFKNLKNYLHICICLMIILYQFTCESIFILHLYSQHVYIYQTLLNLKIFFFLNFGTKYTCMFYKYSTCINSQYIIFDNFIVHVYRS